MIISTRIILYSGFRVTKAFINNSINKFISQLCSNALPLFKNNNTEYLRARLNLMVVRLASVSKHVNNQWHYHKYGGDYGTPTIITLLANQHLFWQRIFHCWGVVAQIYLTKARENLLSNLLKDSMSVALGDVVLKIWILKLLSYVVSFEIL